VSINSSKLQQVEVPAQLEPSPKVVKRSRTDPDSPFFAGARRALGAGKPLAARTTSSWEQD
jgi:hypothetical protein